MAESVPFFYSKAMSPSSETEWFNTLNAGILYDTLLLFGNYTFVGIDKAEEVEKLADEGGLREGIIAYSIRVLGLLNIGDNSRNFYIAARQVKL
ncbi:hypothetical protein R83H12_02200 [Fibrobacteria bacterium R8-3-H12]